MCQSDVSSDLWTADLGVGRTRNTHEAGRPPASRPESSRAWRRRETCSCRKTAGGPAAKLRRVPYPNWICFPRNRHAPEWVDSFIKVVANAEASISTPKGNQLDSDGVLKVLAADLRLLGFTIEKSKAKVDKIHRPAHFGEQGKPSSVMEVDGFHDVHGIALEVEAGRAWNSNAVHRDLVRTSLLLDAQHLALLVPIGYKPNSANSAVPAYANTRDLFDAIYASDRLKLPFTSVLLVGY